MRQTSFASILSMISKYCWAMFVEYSVTVWCFKYGNHVWVYFVVDEASWLIPHTSHIIPSNNALPVLSMPGIQSFPYSLCNVRHVPPCPCLPHHQRLHLWCQFCRHSITYYLHFSCQCSLENVIIIDMIEVNLWLIRGLNGDPGIAIHTWIYNWSKGY